MHKLCMFENAETGPAMAGLAGPTPTALIGD